jgi:hypothetical protein
MSPSFPITFLKFNSPTGAFSTSGSAFYIKRNKYEERLAIYNKPRRIGKYLKSCDNWSRINLWRYKSHSDIEFS